MSQQIVSSISGLPIYAPSAAYAPTNSADVSAIASGYQVVSATATQLYAGTAFLTEVNGAPVSASRAGNAANASMANSAYYDGTGRLISALPDSTTVSSIASSYAESAASGKADSSSLSSYALSSDVSGVIDTVSANSASWGQGGVDSATVSAIASSYVESGVSSKLDTTAQVVTSIMTADYQYEGLWVTGVKGVNDKLLAASFRVDGEELASQGDISGVIDTVSANSAIWGQGGVDSATVSAIASAYQVVSSVGDDGTFITSINGSALSGAGGGATGNYVETSATEVTIGSGNTATDMAFAQGVANSASGSSLAQGRGNTANNQSLAQGYWNTAMFDSMAQGFACTATYTGFAQGNANSAYYYSVAQGNTNSAAQYSFVQGRRNTANVYSFAHGDSNSAKNTAVVFGTYNLSGNGSTSTGNSAAFAIGDGTASNARHDLMLVTKNGEITMFSSTADTVGTGIMSSIRAISAAATGGGIDSATCSAIASSYAESAVSSKADASALSSYALSSDVSGVIDTVSANSATWGGATGDYVENSALDSATARSATGYLLPLVTGISSISGEPLIPTLLAQPTVQYGGQSTFAYMPETSLWTTADAATGVFSPLQYATGACLAMDAAGFKAYYKGNEWFVSNTVYGMLRGEIHQSRGIRIVGSAKDSASGFQLHPSGVNGVSSTKTWGLNSECVSGVGGNGTAWQYGTSENIMLTSVHDTVSANSASWGQGGVDSATVSAIASSYAESAASSKQDSSGMSAYVEKTAYDDLYSAFTAVSSMLNTYSSYFSSISAKVDSTAIGVE